MIPKMKAPIPIKDTNQQILPTKPILYSKIYDPHATNEHISQTNVPKGIINEFSL